MCPQKSEIISETSHSRRSFLKKISSGSAVLAGALASANIYSNNKQLSFQPGHCTFSALPEKFIYLNSGTEGSMPDCVISTFQQGLQQWASNPTTSYELDAVFGKRQDLNREKVAGFFGVDKDNICLTDNTTMGLSMVILGLNFSPKDNVVITNHEHNAILSPLQILHEKIGLSIKTQNFPPAKILSQMNSKELIDWLFPDSKELRNAKALCVSHVYPTTGVRLPLKELRKKAAELNIKYLIVDGAQAMGMLDLGEHGEALKNCDFYAGPGHKWLNGPPSTGVLYIKNKHIRPPEFYPIGSQRMTKYSDHNADSEQPFPMAKALQVRGCSNTPGFTAMLSAMTFIQQAGGSPAIEKQILKLSNQVKNLIESQAPHCLISPHLDAKLLSGLSVFFPFKWDNPHKFFTDKKTADWVVAELLKKNIQIRSIGFNDVNKTGKKSKKLYVLRVSTAFFNTETELAFFKSALKEVLMRIG